MSASIVQNAHSIVLSAPSQLATIQSEALGDGVLVSLESSLISVGDHRAVRGSRRTAQAGKPFRYPRHLGSSAIGFIVELENQPVDLALAVGDRVVVSGILGCGVCGECLAGNPNRCERVEVAGIDTPEHGLWASKFRVARERLFPISSEVDVLVAAFASEIATVVHVVKRAGALAGKEVAVIGAGAHGALAVGVLRSMGASSVSAIDPRQSARLTAASFGSNHVFTPALFLEAVTTGQLNAPQIVFVMTSAVEAVGLACAVISPLGKILALGIPDDDEVSIADYYQNLIVKEAEIIGAFAKDPEDWRMAVQILESRLIEPAHGVETIPFRNAEKRLYEIAQGWPHEHRYVIVNNNRSDNEQR